jgi:serine/threonine-protein kinase
MERSSASPSPPPIAVGRYAMHGPIGAGGMATVHLGRLVGDAGFARMVAIKRLRPHLAHEPDIVASFADEARLAARIRHPNVVSMLDIVSKEGEAFLVMDYVEGVSLASLVRACAAIDEPVPPPVAAAIVAQALHGLHAAHEARNESGEMLNLVHRDVSPHNVLVGVDGVARVADFGVAKAIGRQQTTRDGSIKGKLGYMAPEQLAGRAVTRKADVFAAGVVLWELLTGQRLFGTDDDAVTLTKTLFEPIKEPSRVCASAPRALDPVVMRALERDPVRRFASGDEMATALEHALPLATTRAVGEWARRIGADELADRARQVEAIERGASGVRPRRPVAVVVGLVAAPLAVAAALTGWFAHSRERTPIARPPPAEAPSENVAAAAPGLEGRAAPAVLSAPSSLPPAPTDAASLSSAPSTSAPSAIAPRRPSPRAVPPKAAPPPVPSASARARLYSRD